MLEFHAGFKEGKAHLFAWCIFLLAGNVPFIPAFAYTDEENTGAPHCCVLFSSAM